jgi:hypothetical protein
LDAMGILFLLERLEVAHHPVPRQTGVEGAIGLRLRLRFSRGRAAASAQNRCGPC